MKTISIRIVGIVNQHNKCTPPPNPNKYTTNSRSRLPSGSRCFSIHSKASQIPSAVNSIEGAYTSASTALNQKVSENARLNAATAPPTYVVTRSEGVSNFPFHNLINRTVIR